MQYPNNISGYTVLRMGDQTFLYYRIKNLTVIKVLVNNQIQYKIDFDYSYLAQGAIGTGGGTQGEVYNATVAGYCNGNQFFSTTHWMSDYSSYAHYTVTLNSPIFSLIFIINRSVSTDQTNFWDKVNAFINGTVPYIASSDGMGGHEYTITANLDTEKYLIANNNYNNGVSFQPYNLQDIIYKNDFDILSDRLKVICEHYPNSSSYQNIYDLKNNSLLNITSIRYNKINNNPYANLLNLFYQLFIIEPSRYPFIHTDNYDSSILSLFSQHDKIPNISLYFNIIDDLANNIPRYISNDYYVDGSQIQPNDSSITVNGPNGF